MNHAISVAANLVTLLIMVWLVWRSLRTGILGGNPQLDVRRDERPFKFWASVAPFVAIAIFMGLSVAGVNVNLLDQ